MDNGEQGGRYINGYAAEFYPASEDMRSQYGNFSEITGGSKIRSVSGLRVRYRSVYQGRKCPNSGSQEPRRIANILAIAPKASVVFDAIYKDSDRRVSRRQISAACTRLERSAF